MPRIEPGALEAFAEELLVELGTPRDGAAAVAASLVSADLAGHGSHGVRRIASKYAREIDEGVIDPAAEPVVERDAGAWAVVDGREAWGQLVGRTAVDAAVERAAEHGVGVAGLKHTSHIGRVGEWTERAAEAGMAFAAFVCNPASAWVAPAGSADRRFSTNPVSVGVPSFGALPFPLVVDVATSQVAHGKVKARAAAGEDLPEEWLVGPSGDPLTDAEAYRTEGEGALLPLGGRSAGYKGTGLAVVSELLAANVADGTVSGMDDVVWGNHAAFFAADLAAFTTEERAAERAAAMAEHLRSAEAADGAGPGDGAKGEEVLLPGEAEHRARRARRESGIPLSSADAAALGDLARDAGVDDVPAALR